MENIIKVESNNWLNYINNNDNNTYEFLLNDSIDLMIDDFNEEIQSIDIDELNMDLSDYILTFTSGILGGLADIFIGKPGGYSEPEIKDNSFFGLGKKLKQYDLKNNPIDKQIPGTFGGDHRLYSYGHDLFRFNKGLHLVKNGRGILGISGTGGQIFLQAIPKGYNTPSSMFEAALVLLLHLYKDFWTARSLPIPGVTFIADINNNEMPELIHDLTNNHEVNLRQMVGQMFSIAIIELSIRIWLYLKYRKTDISKKKIEVKKNKMLLLGHSLASLFNLGKVVVTKNPFFLNVAQMMRILMLSWKVVKEKTAINNMEKQKVNLLVLKNKYKTLKTIVLMDKAIYYAKEIDMSILKRREDFYKNLDQNRQAKNAGFLELEGLINNLRNL